MSGLIFFIDGKEINTLSQTNVGTHVADSSNTRLSNGSRLVRDFKFSKLNILPTTELPDSETLTESRNNLRGEGELKVVFVRKQYVEAPSQTEIGFNEPQDSKQIGEVVEKAALESGDVSHHIRLARSQIIPTLNPSLWLDSKLVRVGVFLLKYRSRGM